ncbi:MAG: sigma-54-dependent Fis family transcriptional regulator [Planctomycetes bacterium]|nr:sigma-54-dependent Fis family transcriptional regulator [Planctomycetota bacterium]
MSRLLVVDEDSGRRLILRSRLSEAGYELVVAENGARGLVEARNGAFDAVLVDARLTTGVDGCEVCRRIKAAPELAHVPVVVYVDDATAPEEMARAYESGCDLFVSRPELPALEHALRVLARHRTRVEELAAMVQALSAARADGGAAGSVAEPARRSNGPEHESALAAEQLAALRELAAGRPDGVLVVDAEGLVRHADRGACELLGGRVELQHLGSLIPASGLEAHVRDARVEARESVRFDLPARRGRPARPMTAVVVPLLGRAQDDGLPLRVVEFHDLARRRVAAEALRVCEPALTRAEAAPLIEAARAAFRPAGLLGTSAAAERLREEAARAAAHHDPVLIRGERGSGRGRVARTIHWSGTATGAFVELRCGAHAEERLAAELFGVARGARSPERPGLLHLAVDGTLLLEEVAELPAALQARLARFLETGQLERCGSSRAERISTRIVATSSAPLEEAVSSGRFSSDLLLRLARHAIDVPRLADRPEDVEPLAQACVSRFGAGRGVSGITPAALAALSAHSWPGNIDELESCLERAVAKARGALVGLEDLPRVIRDLADPAAHDALIPRPPRRAEPGPGAHSVPGLPGHELQPAPKPLGAGWSVPQNEPVSLELYEKLALLRAIAECAGNKLEAAHKLKLGKSTMYRKLKRYGIS